MIRCLETRNQTILMFLEEKQKLSKMRVRLFGAVGMAAVISLLFSPTIQAQPVVPKILPAPIEPIPNREKTVLVVCPASLATGTAALSSAAQLLGIRQVILKDQTTAATPASAELSEARKHLLAGERAYDGLQLAQAQEELLQTLHLVQAQGGSDLTHEELFSLFLYRALILRAQGDQSASYAALLRAAVIGPTEQLDPAHVPPPILTAFARAQEAVKSSPKGQITVAASGNQVGSVWIDGLAQGVTPLQSPP
jgi:hypothetical protein